MATKHKAQELLGRFRDEDGTEKFVFKTQNGVIEITSICNKKGIDVFCVPTHHYCNLGCKFCHLTEDGDSSKSMDKITARTLRDVLVNVLELTGGNSNCLLSFMGVGEPFLNADLIVETYKALNPKYENLSLALSTMMPTIKPIDFFIAQTKQNNLPLKIHFSMHSPLDEIRHNIIPCSRYSIRECLEALIRYREAVNGNSVIKNNLAQFHSENSPIEIHYTIINGINDSQEELEKLIEYGENYKIPLKILKFNPTKSLKTSRKAQKWFKVLSSRYNASVVMYAPPGPNIGSSCGQFTKHYYLGSNSEQELREFKAWKKKYQVFD